MTDTKIIYRDGSLNARDRRILTDVNGDTPVNAEHPEQRAALIAALAPLLSTLTVKAGATAYAEMSVASMSAGQAAATAPVLAANAARTALMINPPSDCVLRIGSGSGGGYPLFGGVPNALTGQECPTNALYITGLAAGASVTVWEG